MFQLIFHDLWLEFVNFYAERLIFLPFYDYWSAPFTPLKNLLSPNLGKSMSETCQDLERQSLNKLVFLTYSPFEIRKVSQFSILIDWWMKPNQDITCKTKIYENSQCYQKIIIILIIIIAIIITNVDRDEINVIFLYFWDYL